VPSLRGHFLLASPTLTDPNFVQTVVLLVQHDKDGAVGLVLNRPLKVSVAEAMGSELDFDVAVESTLFKGGPCVGPLMALTGAETPFSDEVVPGVHFAAKDDALRMLLSTDVGPTRFTIGYAGWSADQLERELAEGDWTVVPAAPQDVFAEPVDMLWHKLMSRANLMKFISPDAIPDDPHSN
jgi:putative transcriptional regulator